MRALILALALLIPTLASAQTYTAAQRNGLYKAAIDAAAWLRVQGNTPTVVNGTQLRFAGTVPAGTPCARCSVYLDDADVVALGLNPSAPILTGPSNRYAVLQICGPAVPLATREYAPPRWLTDLIDTCSKTLITAAATWPVAIVAHRTDATAQTVSTGFACACSTGSNCTVGGKAAPRGTTLQAGTWSGAGCRLKSCVELYGFASYPSECPLQ